VNDVIGIGTSPLVLLRAVRLTEFGYRVVLCDRASVFGGAWAAPDLLGFKNVEPGVHIIENRPSLERSLRTDFGIRMKRDLSVGLLGRTPLPMSIARVLFHGAIGAKALVRRRHDKARRSLQSAWRAASCVTAPFYYPKDGASEMIHALSSRFLENKGVIKLRTSVLRVVVTDSGVTSDTCTASLKSKKVLISSRAFASVFIRGTLQEVEIEKETLCNAVLHLATPKTTQYAYVEMFGDANLKRVRNLGSFVQPPPAAGEALLCVQYRSGAPNDGIELGRYLLRHLIRLRIVHPSSDVIALHRNEIEVSTITDRALLRLSRESGGRIEPILSTDFAEGFVSDPINF
jgi:hypothetical protein